VPFVAAVTLHPQAFRPETSAEEVAVLVPSHSCDHAHYGLLNAHDRGVLTSASLSSLDASCVLDPPPHTNSGEAAISISIGPAFL
jgi:hypothetical protein